MQAREAHGQVDGPWAATKTTKACAGIQASKHQLSWSRTRACCHPNKVLVHETQLGQEETAVEKETNHAPSLVPGQPRPVRVGARPLVWLPLPNGPGPDESVFDNTPASTAHDQLTPTAT
jgi:hypothetical protein